MFAKLAVAAAVVVPFARAHMEMVDPPALRNQKNPQYKDSPLIDYSYKAPMDFAGNQFPCKGYIGDVGTVATAGATVNAGSTFPVQLSGGAVHGGGSCQFSFSYDMVNFGVVHEIIGNCPMADQKFDVPIPAEMPSGKNVVFAWTWFNKVGNREMYMNCAVVDVLGTSGAIELPQMFRANTYGEGECRTPEGVDVDFNNPVLDKCSADKLITKDKKVTIGSGTPSTPTTPPPTNNDPPKEPPKTETPPTTGSGAGAWAADKVYVGGDVACYNGVSYTAKWWTQGETPGAGDVWGAGGAC